MEACHGDAAGGHHGLGGLLFRPDFGPLKGPEELLELRERHFEAFEGISKAFRRHFGGSGYFIDLPANKSHASMMLRDLHVWRWVDKLTRATLGSRILGQFS